MVPEADADYSTDPDAAPPSHAARIHPTETLKENDEKLSSRRDRGKERADARKKATNAPAGNSAASPHEHTSATGASSLLADESTASDDSLDGSVNVPEDAGVVEAGAQTSVTQPSLNSSNLQPESMVPLAIRQSGEATWYVRLASGEQYGPAPSDTFVQWLIENRVTRDSLVWCDGWPEWQSAQVAFSDYFGSTSPSDATRGQVENAQSDHTALSSDRPPELPSLSERNRESRRRRKKRNYTIMLAALVLLTIGLLSALVIILLMQSNQAVS